ncbi:MAG: hypothetical protein ACE5KU_05485 [Nitrososphaerales archaeon]
MVSEKRVEGRLIHLCDECGFGYLDKETAQACEDYCSKYNSCSFQITRQAVYRPEE